MEGGGGGGGGEVEGGISPFSLEVPKAPIQRSAECFAAAMCLYVRETLREGDYVSGLVIFSPPLPIHLSAVSTHLSVYLSIYSICLSVCLSIYLLYLSIYSICLSNYLLYLTLTLTTLCLQVDSLQRLMKFPPCEVEGIKEMAAKVNLTSSFPPSLPFFLSFFLSFFLPFSY